MPETVFIAINGDALYDKSKVYIGRALRRKADEDFDEYQFWCSLALELLGKATLAKRHPSLIVNPTNGLSLLAAAGIKVSVDVKTITAKTLFERLFYMIPRFDKTIQEFCENISERRNAELHSGEIPFKAMNLDAWEKRYWHVCDTILQQMESSLEEWLGADGAYAPRLLLVEAAKARDAAVKLRIQSARAEFKKLTKAKRERLSERIELQEPQHHDGYFKYAYEYDLIWTIVCPACESDAFMAGMQSSEDISQDPIWEEDGYREIVDCEYLGEEFRCPICGLTLFGSDEFIIADLDYIHDDQQEREIEYEPDYGND